MLVKNTLGRSNSNIVVGGGFQPVGNWLQFGAQISQQGIKLVPVKGIRSRDATFEHQSFLKNSPRALRISVDLINTRHLRRASTCVPHDQIAMIHKRRSTQVAITSLLFLRYQLCFKAQLILNLPKHLGPIIRFSESFSAHSHGLLHTKVFASFDHLPSDLDSLINICDPSFILDQVLHE